MTHSAPSPIAPFEWPAHVAALTDLHTRLLATRWPDAPDGAAWSLGADQAYLRELTAYWLDEFDWPARQAALARFPHLRVQVHGLGIHVVHARAADRGAPTLPLILNHGWPDSFWRYTKVIELLTDPGAHGGDPADAFDVVVPDMPGYGYSDTPAGGPLDSIAVAGLWAELMTTLGYPRFGTAGGDIGSHVSRYLALDHPGPCRGRAPHRRRPAEPRLRPRAPLAGRTRLVRRGRGMERERGRVRRDPPHETADRRRRPHRFTGRSGRLDRREAAGLERLRRRRRELLHQGRDPDRRDDLLADRLDRLVHAHVPGQRRTTNLVSVTEPARGGHFAAFEQPESYVRELREFFRPFR